MKTQTRSALLAGILLVAMCAPGWAQEAAGGVAGFGGGGAGGAGEASGSGGRGAGARGPAPAFGGRSAVRSSSAAAFGAPEEVPEGPRVGGDFPDSLEELVEMAQRNSPEVIIAEAQLREAEARLQQAKLEATQKAIEMYRDKKVVELARTNVETEEQKFQSGRGTQKELLEARERLAELEASLESANAALRIMEGPPRGGMGGQHGGSMFGGGGANLPNPEPLVPDERPKLPDESENEVVQALKQPVSIEFQDCPLSEVADFISEYVGVNIVVDLSAEHPITISVRDIPLYDAFLAFADLGEDICVVIRESYIFITTEQRAMTISAPTIPDSVPLYVSADRAEQAERQRLGALEDRERQRQMEAARADAKREAAKP